MTDGGVKVRQRGEVAHVDIPSMNGQIGIDVDQGKDGNARVFVPSGAEVMHDESLNGEGEELEADDEAMTDGGMAAKGSLSTRLVGTGIEEKHVIPLAAIGALCLFLGALGTAAQIGAVVAGALLTLLASRAYFVRKATGDTRVLE